MGDKVCARVLERFLEGLEIFGDKKDFTVLFYYSGNTLVGGKNHQTLANFDRKTLAREYQRHIPQCPECSEVYIGFLERQMNEKNHIEEVDKRYFKLWPKLPLLYKQKSKKSAS